MRQDIFTRAVSFRRVGDNAPYLADWRPDVSYRPRRSEYAYVTSITKGTNVSAPPRLTCAQIT